MVESGGFYSTVVDPLLVGMRTKVSAYIPKNQRIIDIACGTGAQAFELAKRAKFVVGVDLSESMIKKAGQTKNRFQISNTEFKVCDATQLNSFSDKEFDIATMSLALHQFQPKLHAPILSEMKRIANRIIIVDYAVPLPKNLVGYASKWAEFMAGIEHNRNFKKFYRKGGLETILNENKITIDKSVIFARGAFQLIVSSPNG